MTNPKLKLIKSCLGLGVILIMLWTFLELQKSHQINFIWPRGWTLLAWIGLLPMIPLLKVISWHQMTRSVKLDIGFHKTLEACILSIAGRYIPGKILFVIGRVSSYGPEKSKLSLATLIMVIEFLVENCAGALLLICAAGLGLFPDAITPWLIVAASMILGAGFIPPLLNKLLDFLPTRFQISPRPSFQIKSLIATPLLCTLMHWAFYLGAIQILTQPFIELSLIQTIGLGASLGFASTAGTLAIFTPGGLGVRESLTTLFLSSMGIAPELGFTIAISARLCQWGGEISLVGLFLLGKLIKPSLK